MVQLAGWVNSHLWLFAEIIPLAFIATLATLWTDRSGEPLFRFYRYATSMIAISASILVGICKHF